MADLAGPVERFVSLDWCRAVTTFSLVNSCGSRYIDIEDPRAVIGVSEPQRAVAPSSEWCPPELLAAATVFRSLSMQTVAVPSVRRQSTDQSGWACAASAAAITDSMALRNSM